MIISLLFILSGCFKQELTPENTTEIQTKLELNYGDSVSSVTESNEVINYVNSLTKNEKGELDGESTTFDKRSQKIIEKISYKNNKINGLYISYFYSENKSGRTEVPYIDDKKEGTAL